LSRWGAAAGMAAPVLFVGVFFVEGALRPGYSAVSLFVSELSIGSRGWTQIANFVVTGTLVAVFAQGLRAELRGDTSGTAGPVLLQIIGVALVASGPFVTDPSAQLARHTVHGSIHQSVGAVVFALAPASCLVLRRRFRRDPRWRGLSGWTLAAGVALVVEVVVLKVAQQPDYGLFLVKGLVQRILLTTFMAWVFTVALRLWTLGGSRAEHPAPMARGR
jgi:hypothetical protein